MRLAYYIAYNPITKSYVGVFRRAYKEKLERLAASIYYDRYQGNFVAEGKAYDPDFSVDVLPKLVKIFNNRMTSAFKYYSSKKAKRSVAIFAIPDRVRSTFPEEFSKYEYAVAVFDTSEIEDLRDAERIYLYDNKQEAIEDYSEHVLELKTIDEYGKGDGPEPFPVGPKVRGTLTRLRGSSLLSRLSRFRIAGEGLRRFERSESSWDFLS